MKKMFATVALASLLAVACQGKKASTTPPTDKAPMETKDDATGGATYGGKAEAGKDTPNPSSPN